MQKKKYCCYCGNRLIKKFFEGRDRLFCEDCNEPLYENPLPATCLVVIDNKKKVLLVKRAVEPKKGYWCLPGGFIELGETIEKAGLRELKEETGLSGRIERFLGIASHASETYSNVIIAGFLIIEYSGKLIAGDDAVAVDFFPMDKLPQIAFGSHHAFIRIYNTAYENFYSHEIN